MFDSVLYVLLAKNEKKKKNMFYGCMYIWIWKHHYCASWQGPVYGSDIHLAVING